MKRLLKLFKFHPVNRYVEKGVKFIILQTNSFNENPHSFIGKRTAVIYRSQLTDDEDWYEILNSLAERQAFDYLVTLGDNFEKKIHEKWVSLEF